MLKLLYLTSSSYSGSTLFTFLVNQHPSIFSIGELEGWDYGDAEFKCSCNSLIEDCPFFKEVAKEYEKKSLSFSTKNFGTKLILSKNKTVNRYLTSGIPYLQFSPLEHARDYVLRHLPLLKDRFRIARDSNTAFVRKSLEYSDADVFLDATKNPYRLRFLSTISDFDLTVLYMVRDFRGVVASNIRKKHIDAEFGIDQWIHEQETILRILKEYPRVEKLYYEDLCKFTNSSLNEVYNLMGLDEYRFDGDFRKGDHHILGNTMRVSNVNEISLDQRWKTELDKKQIDLITDKAYTYSTNGKNSELRNIVKHYLDSE
ncbi:MAG: hypothetical protein ABW079_01990 [Sedimenticola sp.]